MTRIAALQLSANHVVADNLSRAENLILTAVDKGAEIVALPEAFAHYAMDMDDRMAHVEVIGQGRVQDFLANTALKNQIWLVGGTLLIRDQDDKIYISCLIFNDKGERVGMYRKMHLFEANLSPYEHYSEASFAEAGNQALVLATPFGRLACSVCFDLRFPKLYQNLFNLGAEIIFAPSCFTYTTGRAHWEILLRARAIDTFSYLIAPAQYGCHTNGKRTYGHSMIVNPWGEIATVLVEERDGVILHDVDLKQVYQARKKIYKRN